MIRILASCCLIAFLSVSQGACQDQADAKTPAEAKQITAQIRKVNTEFRAEDQKLFKKFQAAGQEEKQKILRETRPALMKKYALQLWELAEQHRNTPHAVEALALALPLNGRDLE